MRSQRPRVHFSDFSIHKQYQRVQRIQTKIKTWILFCLGLSQEGLLGTNQRERKCTGINKLRFPNYMNSVLAKISLENFQIEIDFIHVRTNAKWGNYPCPCLKMLSLLSSKCISSINSGSQSLSVTLWPKNAPQTPFHKSKEKLSFPRKLSVSV